MISPKVKPGDRVRILSAWCGVPDASAVYSVYEVDEVGFWIDGKLNPGHCRTRIMYGHHVNAWEIVAPQKPTATDRAIAQAEADLAALKERAALKARQAADRKAKAERAKVMRGLSPAGKRVAAMLQAGSASDFGCQREVVIKLVAAITGDKPDAISKAVAH